MPNGSRSGPGSGAHRRPLSVLVVDDSAVVRQMMTTILSQNEMTVVVAGDPIAAMERMKQHRFDVIVLDIEMPRMDGLTFLDKLMKENPLPVVICSGLAKEGSDVAFWALQKGAVEIMTKPTVGLREFLEETAIQIVDTVRAAARARVGPPRASLPSPGPKKTADAVLPPVARSPVRITTDKVVAVGASTGGTEAICLFLHSMPPDSPGIVIVQHMPEAFTGLFAKRLNEFCSILVKEADSGDRVIPGRALIARGNRHLVLKRTGAHYLVEFAEGPLVSRHRPSVDVLFRSVAQAAGPNGIGVILTGMGEDGAQGLLELRQAGGATIAQDEATSVVWGMPKEALDRGAVEQVLPIEKIAGAVLQKASESG